MKNNTENFTEGTTFIKWYFSNVHNICITIGGLFVLCGLIYITGKIEWFIWVAGIAIAIAAMSITFSLERKRWKFEKRRLRDGNN